jgi:hypothetical protein
MKNQLLLLVLLLFAWNVGAQFIYSDFDGNQNVTFSGWPNAPETIANPDPSGINTSANVGQWVRTGEQWAHVFTILDGKIDFTDFQQFSLKVWSPITCTVLFKLEDKLNGAVFVEAGQPVTTPNAWEQLTFDFTGAASGVYDKIVIFFDFSATNDNTFFFDDVEGPGYAGTGGKPLLEADVQDNFENNGWGNIDEWFIQDPELSPLAVTTDPINATNHAADYTRSGSFEWTNAQFILDHRMDLSERHVFNLAVYFPSSNDYTGSLTPTASVKLQNSLLGPNAWTTQTEVKLTVSTFDAWQTLSFDFVGAKDSVNYDQVVVQLGGEGHFVPGQFYFDDFVLQGTAFIGEQMAEPLSVYPNPASNVINFSGIERVMDLRIYDMTGNTIRPDQVKKSMIDISNLSEGLYVIRVLDEEGRVYAASFLKK